MGIVAWFRSWSRRSYAWCGESQSLLTHVFRCPTCAQQIRYTRAARRQGHCPRCWKPVTLPAGDRDAARSRGRRRGLKFGRLPVAAQSAERRV